MCDEVKYNMHFGYPDRGIGQVSGPITYTSDGANMDFEKPEMMINAVLGKGNYVIDSITMRPWYKNFILSFRITSKFIDCYLPIGITLRDYCKRATDAFDVIAGNTTVTETLAKAIKARAEIQERVIVKDHFRGISHKAKTVEGYPNAYITDCGIKCINGISKGFPSDWNHAFSVGIMNEKEYVSCKECKTNE